MRILIPLLAAVLLTACAAPQQLASAPARDTGVIVTATLAPLGSFEWQVAPDYTRLATVRRLAARALTNERITLAQAVQVQVEADAARKALDEAVSLGGGSVAESLVAQARERITRAAALVEAAR